MRKSLAALSIRCVRPGTPVPQDRHRFIHRGVRRRQFGSHAGIVVRTSRRHLALESDSSPPRGAPMRIGNLSGRLTLFTDRGAVDVAQASGGRFSSDPQAIYDVWDDFVSWASTLGRGRRRRLRADRPPSTDSRTGAGVRDRAEQPRSCGRVEPRRSRHLSTGVHQVPHRTFGSDHHGRAAAGRSGRLGGRARRGDRPAGRERRRGGCLVPCGRPDRRAGHLRTNHPTCRARTAVQPGQVLPGLCADRPVGRDGRRVRRSRRHRAAVRGRRGDPPKGPNE